jgi:hypothetical protein
METVLNTFARWMIVFALMLAYWPFGRNAHAAAPPVSSSVSFKKALYTASFEWKGAPYLFTIGTVERAPSETERSRFMATISKGEQTLAVCERTLSGEAPFDLNSMTLRCEGQLFSPLAATAKFYYSDSLDKPQLMIQTAPHVQKQVALVGLRDTKVAKSN